MKVILLEEVPNLGEIGALVKVAPGYGRNFLLPKKLAMMASVHNERRLEHEKRIIGFRRAKAKAAAEQVAKKLSGLNVVIARKVGEQDKLYGSVTAHDVHEALIERGMEVDRRKIDLHEPIKALGDYQVAIRLVGDLRAEIKVSVVPE